MGLDINALRDFKLEDFDKSNKKGKKIAGDDWPVICDYVANIKKEAEDLFIKSSSSAELNKLFYNIKRLIGKDLVYKVEVKHTDFGLLQKVLYATTPNIDVKDSFIKSLFKEAYLVCFSNIEIDPHQTNNEIDFTVDPNSILMTIRVCACFTTHDGREMDIPMGTGIWDKTGKFTFERVTEEPQ